MNDMTNRVTKHQSSPLQNSCKFGRSHGPWSGPIFRNGLQVSPTVQSDGGFDDEWVECSTCGRVEDEQGNVVLNPPFERCAR